MRDMLAGILMALGLLICCTSGLCSIIFFAAMLDSGSRLTIDDVLETAGLVLAVGGIPFAIGLLMFVLGRDRSRGR